MTAKIIDGKKIAQETISEIKEAISKTKKEGIQIHRVWQSFKLVKILYQKFTLETKELLAIK